MVWGFMGEEGGEEMSRTFFIEEKVGVLVGVSVGVLGGGEGGGEEGME